MALRFWLSVTHVIFAFTFQSFDEMDPTTAALEKEHETMTKVKYINSIQVCVREMRGWRRLGPESDNHCRWASMRWTRGTLRRIRTNTARCRLYMCANTA